MDSLIGSLPGDPALEDRTVWWTLVTAFEATADWARQARERHAEAVVRWSKDAVADTSDAAYESRRAALRASGSISAILTGQLTHTEVGELIRRHLGALTIEGGEDTESAPDAA